MKKIFIPLTIILLASCQNSPTDKANALIKDNMQKNLIIADSYEPVETKINSAFTPFDAPEFYTQTLDLLKLSAELQEHEEKAKQAKSSMTLWNTPYADAYIKNRYQESKTEYEEYTKKRNAVKERIEETVGNIKEMMQKKPEFIGFKAMHRYRASNNAGQTLLGDKLYILSKDLTEIIASYNMDSEEYIAVQEAMKQIRKETDY